MKKVLATLFAVALGLNLSAQTDYVDDWNPDADGDNNVGVSDLLALLSVFAENDDDDDGIWDSQDDCVGEYDECGVCNGEGPTVQVIDSIIVNYDSVFVDVLGEWLVFELSTDTVYSYQCFWECEMPWEFDGYEYSTVQIGGQCWFAENLRTTVYSNGDVIPAYLDDNAWGTATVGATSVYGEGDSDCNHASPEIDACEEFQSLAEYGRLYNWYAVDDTRGLCPSGWHVPSDLEWMELEGYIANQGFAGIEGTALKSSAGWDSNGTGTDNFGFSGHPGGHRDNGGAFGVDSNYGNIAGRSGYWWSSSPNNGNAIGSYLSYNWSTFFTGTLHITYGFSVRCVRDE